jgi:hypothetical protein
MFKSQISGILDCWDKSLEDELRLAMYERQFYEKHVIKDAL